MRASAKAICRLLLVGALGALSRVEGGAADRRFGLIFDLEGDVRIAIAREGGTQRRLSSPGDLLQPVEAGDIITVGAGHAVIVEMRQGAGHELEANTVARVDGGALVCLSGRIKGRAGLHAPPDTAQGEGDKPIGGLVMREPGMPPPCLAHVTPPEVVFLSTAPVLRWANTCPKGAAVRVSIYEGALTVHEGLADRDSFPIPPGAIQEGKRYQWRVSRGGLSLKGSFDLATTREAAEVRETIRRLRESTDPALRLSLVYFLRQERLYDEFQAEVEALGKAFPGNDRIARIAW